MKNRYNVSGNQWWLLVLWVLGFGLPVGAQTTQPPVIHWQRVIERQTLNSQVVGQPRVVKASDGGYGVLTAAIGVLAKVSPTGNLIWQTPVPTLLEGNPSIYETTGLTATSDGGFVIVSRDNFGWNISKVDANGNRVWAKQIVPYQTSGLGTVAKTDLIRTADDGFLVVGWSSFPRAMAVADVDKFDQNGDLVWRRSVFYNYDADAIRSSTFGQRVTQTAEGDYVVVGQTRRSSSEPLAGWAAKLNGQGNVIWQNRYEERAALDDIILSPHFSGSYIASGVNNLNADVSNTLNLGADGSPGGGYYQPGRVPGTFSSLVAVPATNGVPAYHTVLDRTNSNSGDFRLTNLAQSDQLVWSKTLGGSGNDIPNDLIATGDGGYLVVGTTTSTDGDVQGKTNNDLATWIIKLAPAAPPTATNPLTLTQPSYNCQTGAITFNTSGGDGSSITYSAPGISRANVTDNFGMVEQGLRNDPKPITITATQSGQTVSYTFDFGAFCSNVPTNGTLKLLAPTVECRSLDASLIINTTGGDGSPITYTVPGATLSSPTSNTANVFECINADNPSLSIQATQSGYTATYSLDLYRACPNTNFGDALIARQIPDLTLSVGQTLQAYDVSQYFTDPNNFLRYNLVASYTFLATGMPEGINYSLLGTNGTNGLVVKFSGTAPSQPGVYTVTITAGTIFCDPVVTSFKIIVTGTPVNPPTGGNLTLTQPTYNCQTGAITFNTTGGDGSPVTYSAPGISRANATDNFGTVEPGLRNDPKPITITATQSDYTTNYAFDLKQFCAEVGDVFPPMLTEPIPDQILVVGQNIEPGSVNLGKYFGDPNGFPRYRPFWAITSSGLPEGVGLATRNIDENVSPFISLFGTPVRTGSYTVTINAALPRLGVSTTASFKIIVTDSNTNPPTSGTLTLTQPTYNCQTGAITFNTSGGDGSPITYSAPGISRVNATDNFGTVEQGLRNDPKPITIAATQSGQTVSYMFDFGAFCSGNPQPPVAPAILPPVVNGPIPAMVRRPNSGRLDEPFVLSQYFSDPTPAHAGYRSNLRFSVDESAPGFFSRLPLGYFLKDLSAVEAPYAIIAGTPTLEGSYTVTVTATNLNLPPPNNSVSTTLSIQIIGRSESNPDNALRLTYPLYNCQTGVIVFNLLSRTTYNPAPIVYTAPGVILESPTSMTGIVESGLRANPGPITIMATQNGETAQYVFDLKSHLSAYCGYVPGQPPVNPPTGGTLTLLAPAYDCGSGALTFRTSGGDGSPIEYQAAGITGWTTNPNQFVDQDSRTANDVSPFMLMARQNGQMVTYTWDLKAACGRARIASSEPEFTPTLTVLGNPVSDQLRVVIRGAAGGPLRLQLTDMRGRLIENRVLEPTTGETEQVFDVTQQAPGLLLLRATTGKQVLTTKVLKR